MIRSFAACGTLGVVFTFVLQNTAAESKSCGGPCGRNGRLSGIRDTRHRVLNTAGNGFKVLFPGTWLIDVEARPEPVRAMAGRMGRESAIARWVS